LALAALAGAALTAAACASTRVGSFVERGADFRHYYTYAWAADPSRTTGDPRLDSNPFFEECVRTAVDHQLASRGFEQIPEGEAQLVLHYHANVSQALEINGADQTSGYCDNCKPFVYDAGSIVLDFVDARTSTLVWRGWSEGSIDGIVDNQRWMEETIHKAAEQILAMLPDRF
jgi:hypothetical protein